MLTIPTPPEECRRLAALCALGVLDTMPEPELDAITQLAADLFDVPTVLISLVDADRQWFKSKVGLDVDQTPRNVAFCGFTILSDAAMIVLDTHRDARFVEHPLVVGAPHIRFYAAAPLVLKGGERVGTLCLIDTAPRDEFTDRETRALCTLARQVVVHLETLRFKGEQRVTELIADTAPDAFIASDTEGDIIYWNPGAVHIFGWSVEEAIGKPLEIIIPPEHHGSHMAGMRRLSQGGTPRLVGKTIEVPAMRKDGSRIMVELTLGMWNDQKTGLPAGYASIMRDVSQRMVTEKKLADQIAAIEAAHEGIAILSPDGISQYMNRAFLDLFGLPHNAADVPCSHVLAPHERERILGGAFQQLRQLGQWTGEVRGLTSSGRIVDCDISLTLKDDAVVAVVRDISQRLVEQREQARLREQLLLAQRQEAVGQLAAGLAHDFNNIIAAIGGSAALIKVIGAPEVQRHAQRIAMAAENAAELVNRLLTAGRRVREYERQDLRPIVEDVCELMQATLSRQHRIRLDVVRKPVVASADRAEILQVLLNLGLNARDALPENEAATITLGVDECDCDALPATLQIGALPDGPCAHLWVEDDGSGMSSALIDQIFEPFFSGARKDSGGTGLGLAMVASIVSAAGGGIKVTSEIGRGSRFDIYWPLQPVSDPALVGEDGDLGDRPLAGEAILLVDDEPAVTDTLAGLLEQAGAEVGPCVSASDALCALAEDPDAWSLLITDFNMPGMNGAELGAKARALRPDLPMALISARPDAPRLKAQCGQLFDAIGPKTSSTKELVTLARKAIAAAEERQ